MRKAQIAAALLVSLAAPAFGEERGPVVSVVGEAQAQVRPDMAILTLSISVAKPAAKDAAAESARLSQAVIDGLKTSGVAADDIQTTGLSLFPEFTGSSASVSRVTGYRASETFSVRVRALEKAGALAGDAVANGALYEGLRFEVSDRVQRLDGLRAAAVENARHRAELYAKGAHMKLGLPRSIAMPQSPIPVGAPRFYSAGAAMTQAGVAPPVEAGLIALQDRVDVTFDLGPP